MLVKYEFTYLENLIHTHQMLRLELESKGLHIYQFDVYKYGKKICTSDDSIVSLIENIIRKSKPEYRRYQISDDHFP